MMLSSKIRVMSLKMLHPTGQQGRDFLNQCLPHCCRFFSIFGLSGNFGLAAVTTIILVMIFVPMFWWVMKHDADGLASDKWKYWTKVTDGTVCRIILIMVN